MIGYMKREYQGVKRAIKDEFCKRDFFEISEVAVILMKRLITGEKGRV